MNDDTADAVDQKPPEGTETPRRRRRPSKPAPADAAPQHDGSGSAETEKTPVGAGAELDHKGSGDKGKESAGAPKGSQDSSGEGSSGSNPRKRPARAGDRKPAAARGARAPSKGGEAAAPGVAATDSAEPESGKASEATEPKGSEKDAPPARRGSGRRKKTEAPDEKPEADVGERSKKKEKEESAGSDARFPDEPGESTDATSGRSRRRRRSRRGSGSAGSPAKGDKGSAKQDGPAERGKAAASADAEGDRPARSSGGRRKRRSARRPKLEHIAPLGPRKMLISMAPGRCQIAVLEGKELLEHYVAKTEDLSTVGNVYVGRVENVLPGMEAAFLDIGESRNAVLYVGEVSYDEEVDGPAPRIETLLKSGQPVVAQVTKDAMGSKGARLTTEVSLAGRYLVLVPDTDSLGISRRLSDAERRRLRDIASRIKPDGHGMIVRTAANGATEQDLERDVKRLVRIWNETAQKLDGAKPPKLVYAEPPLAIRVIRDLFTADVEQVIVDDKDVYEEVREYLEEVTPELADRVEYYKDKMPLYERFHVMEQVRKAVDRKVWLASGGHIVIDRTEAMTVVDVNTGRFVGRSTLEDTVLHANLEAAEEIAKQLRLRDIGGIIVVDFIDMGFERNRDELIRVFENALMRDKTRTQVYGVSELGLVQMTRKKVSEGLLEAFSNPCETCGGRGVILTELD